MATQPRFQLIQLPCLVLGLICGWTSLVWAHGDYHAVVDEIERALKKEPDNADLHFRLAVACQEHGEWTSALVELERAERLAPGKHPVVLIQGQALAKGAQWQAAETVLDEFLIAHPAHAKALAERGRVRMKLNRTDEATHDFRAALANSRHPEPDLFLETAEVLISQGDRSEAAQVLDQGITRLGHIPELLERAIEVAVADGQFEAALSHLEALRQTQQPEEWLARKAGLLAQAGHQAASLVIWRELRDHLLALPNLQRGQPRLSRLLEEAQLALGGRPAPAVVLAPPATARPSASAP